MASPSMTQVECCLQIALQRAYDRCQGGLSHPVCFNPQHFRLPHCNHMHSTKLWGSCSMVRFTWIGRVRRVVVPTETDWGFNSCCVCSPPGQLDFYLAHPSYSLHFSSFNQKSSVSHVSITRAVCIKRSLYRNIHSFRGGWTVPA